jgi:hypothetical protein
LSSKCEKAASGTGVGVGLEEACPCAMDWPDELPEEPLLEPEPDDAEVDVAIPLAGVLLERFEVLVAAPVDPLDSAELFALDEPPLPFEVVSALFCIEELLDFEDGLSVSTAPLELPPVLPEVELAEAAVDVWSCR